MSINIISHVTERIPWEIALKRLVELFAQLKDSKTWDIIKDNDEWKHIIEILEKFRKQAFDEAPDSLTNKVSLLLKSVNDLSKKIDHIQSETESVKQSIKNARIALWLAAGAAVTACMALLILILR